MAGSITAYCSCRDDSGTRYRAGECPKWTQRGHRKWGFIIDLPRVYDEGTGRLKRQQLRKMGFTTRRDAERAMEAELPAIRSGTAPTLADRQITVGEFLDRWMAAATDARGEPWRPNTRASYGRDVRLYLRPGLGHIRLAELRSDDISALWARMRDGHGGEPRSPATIRAAFVTLSSALNQAVLGERISRNPCVAARVATPPRPVIRAWEPRHVTGFLAHARQRRPDLAPAFQLAAWRGLRRGEIVGLRWADVDLDAGTLRVVRNVTEADGQLHVGEPKTECGKRTVSLGGQLVAVLREHRRAQAQRRLAAEEWEDHGLVFPGPDGRLLQPHVLTHGFKRLAAEVPGLPELHLHGLRHTAATQMLLAGVPPKVVQDQLGHATLAMTMDTYGHVLPLSGICLQML
jgi:integrase